VKNVAEGLLIFLGMMALVAVVSAWGRHESFWRTFLYGTVGTVVVAASITASILGFAEIGRRRDPSEGNVTGYAGVGFLFGLLIVAPLAGTLAFKLLKLAAH
jgi:hypothetical protein